MTKEVGFSERMRSRRIEMGISQRDLGRQTGISPPQLSRYEGGSIPRPDIASKIANVLRVNREWLMSGEGDKYPKSVLDVLKDGGIINNNTNIQSQTGSIYVDAHTALYSIEIPIELSNRINESAAQNGRSVYSEIIKRLEKSFSSDQVNESDKLKEYIDLINVFNRLMDNPKLFQALKNRREALQKIKPLQDFLTKHADLVDEEIEKHPNEYLEEIVERVKKRLK